MNGLDDLLDQSALQQQPDRETAHHRICMKSRQAQKDAHRRPPSDHANAGGLAMLGLPGTEQSFWFSYGRLRLEDRVESREKTSSQLRC